MRETLQSALRPGRTLALAVWALAGSGCVKAYQAPTADQPHAVVKIRRAYHVSAGTNLQEYANIGEFRALAEQRAASQSEARTTALLVHPGPARWKVGSEFSHTELRMVREQYSQQVPYHATETYSCGTGTSHRMCTRSVTRYRTETKWRTVQKQVKVSDGACHGAAAHQARQGSVYLLQYSYSGPKVCSLQCMEQRPVDGEQFQSVACEPAPAEDK